MSDKDSDLETRLLNYLQKQRSSPRLVAEIARDLGIHSKERAKLRDIMRRWEKEGRVKLLRRSRYTLAASPETQGSTLLGRIRRLTQSGKFLFIADDESRELLREQLPHLEQHSEFLLRDYGRAGAQDGDLVEVQMRLKPRREYQRRSRKKAPRHLDDMEPEFKISNILKRRKVVWEGVYVDRGRYGAVISQSKHTPEYIALTKPAPLKTLVGMKVLVEPSRFPSDRDQAQGHIMEVLGWPEDEGVKMRSIMRRYNLQEEFPKAVIDETQSISAEITADDIAQRQDWRERCVITIDPETARDFDDAISVRAHEKGWELAVHIADVSHYVHTGSALDDEAKKRGNSTYLPDRVLPMLPPRLCDEICSLKPQVDRLTFLCLMQIDHEGHCYAAKCALAVIRSTHRYNYEEALAILEGRATCENREIAQLMMEAQKLASIMRKRRFAQGALELDIPQMELVTNEFGDVTDVVMEESDEAHALIEEFMLAANEAVAQQLRESLTPTLYRVHEPPMDAKLQELSFLLKQYGIKCGYVASREELQSCLDQIKGHEDEMLLKQSLLRSMMRARYSTKPLGHYGLAKDDYCHFTSPIRRYADLIVHRSLRVLLKLGYPALPNAAQMQSVADHISETERLSASAENEARKGKLLSYLYKQAELEEPRQWDALVEQVWEMGLLVRVPELQLKGLIPVSQLPKDTRWYFERSKQAWVAMDGRYFLAGHQVTVIPQSVDRENALIDFSLISQPHSSKHHE